MRLSALFLFCLLALNLSAQPYESIFGKNSTMWIVQWENLDFGGIDSIVVEKDTLINDIIWKKVISTQPYSWEAALIREDTISGKVWYRYLGSHFESEYLAFDFSLVIGDTFDLSANYTLDRIGTVDSIYYIDNVKHIRFEVSVHPNEAERVTWVEGVSGNQSPIYKESNLFLWPYLLCAFNDGVQIYSNLRHDGDCDPVIAGSTFATRLIDLQVFPNPFQSQLYIDYSASEYIKSIEIIDLSGKLVIKTGFQNYIETEHLNTGVYFARFILEDGQEISRVVQRN